MGISTRECWLSKRPNTWLRDSSDLCRCLSSLSPAREIEGSEGVRGVRVRTF